MSTSTPDAHEKGLADASHVDNAARGDDPTDDAGHENRAVTAPEVPHADLIARLQFHAAAWIPETDLSGLARQRQEFRQVMREAADALDALGDTVPRDSVPHDVDCEAVRFTGSVTTAWTPCGCDERRVATSQRERDEARAERDLIVREVKNTPHASWCIWQEETHRHIGHPCDCYLEDAIKVATAPAASLALHDAEVWDEGAEYAVGYSTAPLYDNPYRTGATS